MAKFIYIFNSLKGYKEFVCTTQRVFMLENQGKTKTLELDATKSSEVSEMTKLNLGSSFHSVVSRQGRGG